MENPNIKKFYQQSAKPFNYVPSDLVDGDPVIPPMMSGLMRIDPNTGNIWISAGNTLVSDWKLITGGGGGSSITLQTNGATNANQTLLNLQEGVGITLVDDGLGTVTVNAASGQKIIMLDSDVTFNADNKAKPLGILQFTTQNLKSYSFKATISYIVSDNNTVGTNWGALGGTPSAYQQQVYYTQVWAATGLFTLPAKSVYVPIDIDTYPTTTYGSRANIAIVEGVLTNTKIGEVVSIIGCGKASGGFGGEDVTVLAGSTLVVYELP